MNRAAFISSELLGQDPVAVAARRLQIQERMAATAAEAQLDTAGRAQLDILRGDGLAVGGTVAHTAGPSWQQRARIGLVLAIGLPAAVTAAYVAARLITALAEWAGAILA